MLSYSRKNRSPLKAEQRIRNIGSLLPSAKEGYIKPVINGLTAENNTVDGAVKVGVVSWGTHITGISGTLSLDTGLSFIGENSVKVAINTTGSGRIWAKDVSNCSVGDKVYASAWIYKVSGSNGNFYVLPAGTVTGSVSDDLINPINAAPVGVWRHYSTIATLTNTGYRVVIGRNITNIAFEYNYDGVMSINLTKLFGSAIAGWTDAELKALGDALFPDYFDGVKSVPADFSLRSVGKNLFDGTYLNYMFIASDGSLTSTTLPRRTTNLIKCEVGKNYTISGGDRSTYRFLDKNLNLVSVTTSTTVPLTITAPANTHYLQVYYSSTGLHEHVQIEEGPVATPYEPFKSSAKYYHLGQTLKSLPNGVRDDDEVKRVSDEYVLQSSDISSIHTGYVHVELIRVLKSVFINGLNVTESRWLSVFNMEENTSAPYDDINNIGKYTTRISTLYVDFFFTKGTTLEQAKAQLAGTKLIYQLATPTPIHSAQDGELSSFPSGTVYYEARTRDSGVYDGGFAVSRVDLEIDEIVSIVKRDIHGVTTLVDKLTAVVAGDKKGFTHPDLVDGDVVDVVYEFVVEGPVPEVDIEFANNLPAQINSNSAGLRVLNDELSDFEKFSLAYMLDLATVLPKPEEG